MVQKLHLHRRDRPHSRPRSGQLLGFRSRQPPRDPLHRQSAGQAKYITCVKGAFLDVVVDLRVGSPTFGEWDAVVIDDVDRRAVFLAEGLGHAILSLEDGSTVMYLCSIEYSPHLDRDLDPFDPELAIDWPKTDRQGNPLTYELSAKDAAAPSLTTLRTDGLLPGFVAEESPNR